MNYLLTLSIGPVQSFIAAARRTRDLWYGSYLLSDVARTIALYMLDLPETQLVFPAYNAANRNELEKTSPSQSPRIANRVTAIIQSDNIRAVVDECKSKAKKRLSQLGDDCLKTLGSTARLQIDESLFLLQLEDILELYAAWVPFEDKKLYKSQLDLLERLLAARKATRDFRPYIGKGGLTLSSLDGERENVLRPLDMSRDLRTVFRIDDQESLDAIGLIKRINGKTQPFPSVIRVALQPWIACVDEGILRSLCTEFDILVRAGLASKYALKHAGVMQGTFDSFPYDGELLLKSRRDKERQRQDAWGNDGVAISHALVKLDELCDSNDPLRKFPAPPEDGLYVAVLQADGDRMGALLDCAQNIEQHQVISKALAGFAREAATVVDCHEGACVYSGGDDVLAILPITTALDCARELATLFSKTMKTLAVNPEMAESDFPTLSVGLAFGHVLAALSELRSNAAAAEKLAKNGLDKRGLRNALAISVQPRGGALVSAVGRWNETALLTTATQGFERRIEFWRNAFSTGALAQSTPYDLWELAREISGPALASQAARLLGRRTSNESSNEVGKAFGVFLGDENRNNAHSLLADELYIARWLDNQCAKFKLSPNPQARVAPE